MSHTNILVKLLVHFLLIQLLGACAVTPKDAPSFYDARAPEPDKKTALVYIYRAFAQPTAYNVKVLINGQDVADLANEGFTWVMLNEGYYKIDIVWPTISAQSDVHFDGKMEGGKTYFYEVLGISRLNGNVSEMGSSLFQVKNEDAEPRIRSCCRYAQAWGNSYYPYSLSKNTTRSSSPEKGEGKIKNYKAIFSGKTANGEHIKKGFQFKDYFREDGVLIEVRNNGKRKEGHWTLTESGKLCIIWESKKRCGQIELRDDGSYEFTRNNIAVRRYRQFDAGNTL